ncbi:MAG: amidohydrolase family protein [Planctomycetota bacterium]
MKQRSKKLFLTLSLSLCACLCVHAADKKGGVSEKDKIRAIVGATVFPVSGPRIRRGTVIWKNGKIIDVGSEIEVPKGAEVIDGNGKYVCPGFVSLSAAGVGASRGQGDLEHSLDPYDRNVEICLAHGITTIHAIDTFPTSGFSAERGVRPESRNAVVKMTYRDLDGMMVKEPALYYYSLPSRQLASELHRVRDEFRRAKEFLKAVEEAKKKKAKPPRLSSSIAQEVAVIQNVRPTVITPFSTKQVEFALELKDEYKFDLILSTPDGFWPRAKELASRSIPVLVKTRGPDFNFNLRDDLVEKGGMIPLRRAAAFRKAGVLTGILPYRRSINTSGLAGRGLETLALDAAFGVRGGLTNDEALATITLDAAKILGVDKRLGSLEKGKDADLLIMNAHPLDYRSFVLKAYVNGKEYFDREKSRIFREVPVQEGKL